MGNVLSANLGQAPARQALIKAGLSDTIPATTVNKVCSSGMKAIIMASQSILCGDNKIVIAGGMENMSRTPRYVSNTRQGQKLGDLKLVDALLKDGLTDAYEKTHMGFCAEQTAAKMKISRQEQDEFAINSYQKSKTATKNNKFIDEIVPVSVPQKKTDDKIISQDEECYNANLDRIPNLKAVFLKNGGTITAANASTLNDGAAAVVLSDKKTAQKLKLKPVAKIVSYADAALSPVDFGIAPAKAIKLALKKANLKINDIDYFEINEAFSVVALANIKLLKLNSDKVNINGGAVSMGHPLGASGARIVATLIQVLKQKKGKLGVAAICNGGGGASCLIIENL
jgi:acetyl-CoA C-acetyltransferase